MEETISQKRKGFEITLGYTNEFVDFWNSLKEKYPEELFKIQGVHNDNFDISKFSKNFFKKSASVASVSVDANANVKEKSIAQYVQEYPKGLQRLNSFYQLFKWVKKVWGVKAAKVAVEKVLNGELFINDFSNFSTSYSYYEQNSIFVRVNGQVKIMTMKDLFDTYEEFKQVFPDREIILTNNVYKEVDCLKDMAIQCHDSKLRVVKGDFFASNQKVLNRHNIEVLDADGKWVGLKQILRHKKHNNLLTYQTESGDFAMVTEDHPVILANGDEVKAGDLCVGMEIKKELPSLNLTETIDVSEDMAYLIGFLLGDGNIGRHKFYQNSKNITNTDVAVSYSQCEATFNIYQKDIKNSKIYEVLKRLYPELNLRFENENRIAFRSRRLKVLTSKLFGLEHGNTSFRKTLPVNILDWKKESIEALVAGLIDSDGTVTPNCTINLRMKAYGLITQLYDILRAIGVPARKCFHENDEMFGVLFAPSDKMWELSYKLNQKEKKEYNPNLNTCSAKNIVQKIHMMPNSKVLPNGEDIYEYVYDITTDSGTFYANGMTQHNCYAFDLRMLLMEGMSFFHGGMKIHAPKRSDSFVALLIQSTAFISNQIMGACSYPDCFVAWDWFLRNEHGQDYMKRVRAGEDEAAKKKILDQFQNLIYSFNFPFRSCQSAFTNLSVMDKGYMKSLFGDYWLPDGTLADLDSSQELSKLFFEYFNEINGKEGMFTFPVMTLSLSLDPEGNYIDPDFKKWISKYNCQKSFSNVFIGEPDIYSSCCRLSNNIKKAGGLGFQNSFGVGGLSLGSHRVAGLNLARISLLEKDNENLLEEDIEMLHKILYAHRKLIKEKISKGVMPLYTSEWISINRQYSTIGITACNQYVANKGLDIKTEEGINCIHRVLKTIETKIEEWQAAETEEFCIYNLEAIPAESVAVRLAQSDRVLGYNDKYEIYSNQYIDLMEDCPVYERFKVQGQLDQLTSGGNILHCNVDGEKPLTPEQYEKIIDLAKDCKVKYFGINYAYSECAKQHYTIGKNKKCPICGEPIVETWCRVVGFITPKSAFNPVRRDYEFDKRVFYESEEVEKATEKEKTYANC